MGSTSHNARSGRESHRQSLCDSEDAIRVYQANNMRPKAFTWIKTADQILTSRALFAVALLRKRATGEAAALAFV